MSVTASCGIAEYSCFVIVLWAGLFLVSILLSLNHSSVLDLSGLYCFGPVIHN